MSGALVLTEALRAYRDACCSRLMLKAASSHSSQAGASAPVWAR